MTDKTKKPESVVTINPDGNYATTDEAEAANAALTAAQKPKK